MTLFFCLGAALLLLGVVARVAVTRAAAGSAVDQYYWLVVARAYRVQRGLPVRLSGKYLMEDETQAYPPLFGWLLAHFDENRRRYLTGAIELVELTVILLFLLVLGAGPAAILVALAVYVAAPVLVVYNAQLTPRILGDFFLFAALSAQAAAVEFVLIAEVDALLWIASAALLSLVIMTHKMTLQLYLVLLPFWWWALGSWQVPMAGLAAFATYSLVVGWRFAIYQFRAHWDIIRFWNRHWRDLGAHQFGHSPIYGNPFTNRQGRFHAPGWRGAVRNLRLVAAYAPFNLVLPLASLSSGTWPPDWLLVWLAGCYGWALATLYVPWLKCLGGGHLYIFNAVAPGALYVAFLPLTPPILALLTIGAALTVASLVMALRIVRRRPTARQSDFSQVIAALAELPAGRVAAFPLQSAEAVAAQTHHAVLWGAHGYGFEKLDGFFPVLTTPLSGFLEAYNIDWILWDSSYWRDGEDRLRAEGALTEEDIRRYGTWHLARYCRRAPSHAGREEASKVIV